MNFQLIFGFLLQFQFISASELSSFCNDYIRCMEQLEIKQRECLALDRNLRLEKGDDCTMKKWDKKLELNSLHMRRVEVARDCAQKFEIDSNIAESTLDQEMHTKCVSQHEKFQFAKNVTSPRKISRKKRSTGKREKRDTTNGKKATECRNNARAWHKQCAALAKCCPLADECKQATQEIMEQIYNERHQLHHLTSTNCH